ncbi:serine-rich adhesin for platelets [Musca vetustissima]|uniref:serine-rich adhesin for platelets n=1 Tax=Musca vetustissima TaxID=27455 RepID=UPI002AB6BC9D|nr:serine-rich adhesin for platelets [Musca vetustissima]
MLSERSLVLSGYNTNSIDSVNKSCQQPTSNRTTPPTTPNLSTTQITTPPVLTVTPTTTAAAAAAYLYLEKVKNERLSPRVTAAQIDSLKDAIMESSAAAAAVAAAMVNNNNNCSSINNNNNNNNNSNNSGNTNSCNNSHSNNNLVLSQNQIVNSLNNSCNNNTTSDEMSSHSLQSSVGQHQHQHQHHPHQSPSSSIHLSSNHVKRERLSPATGTNGDLQSALSRSRSTTPSSFRGPSPQHSVHSSPSETVVPMHNLSTNLLNSIQQAASSSVRQNNINFPSAGISNSAAALPSDFSTRNYSDFMRCLAAKYNNTNPTDSSNSRRQTFFDTTINNATKKTSSVSSKTSYPPPSTSIGKEISITTTSTLPPPPPLSSGAISPADTSLSQSQQNQMAAAVASAAAANTASGGSVSPFMTSFLSSLPFAQGILPPLIDMSSTQALITLARAAKENEMHNILQMNQTSKRSSSNASPSPSPTLNMALQQAAQFISPALLYSAQVQKQQQQVSSQSSPRSANLTNTTSGTANDAPGKSAGDKRTASPLDLSSQPPASKRFKIESNTSSQSSSEGLLDASIKRRNSTPTTSTSPSPPPHSDRPSSPSATPSTTSTTTTTTTAVSSSPAVINTRKCQAHSEEVNSWTVDDVCAFVGSIDICAEYVKHFRDQCIDGSGLPLLTEDHLVNSLGMKLGPALKLRSMLAKKLGGPCPCVACVAQAQQMLALQTAAGITPPNSAMAENAANSYQPKSATLSGSDEINTNSSSNSSSNNNSSSDKTDSTTTTATTKTITTNTNVSAAENTGDIRCQKNVATFSQSTQNKSNTICTNYSSCSSNNNKYKISNRDDNNGPNSS